MNAIWLLLQFLFGMVWIKDMLHHYTQLFSEYSIININDNQLGLELNGAYQIQVYAEDKKITGWKHKIPLKNNDTQLRTNEEVGLEQRKLHIQVHSWFVNNE